VIRFEPPKSDAARRTFTIPSPLVDLLARHLTRRGLTGADPEALVFAGSKGGPLRYSNFRDRVWIPACVATGLGRLVKTESGSDRRMTYQGLGFHDLRRAAATAMVASGVDVRTAQERLGHADPRMTLAVYAQATRAGDKAAADRLGEHFMGGSVSAGAATPSAG
jgi:integrase